FPYTPLFRSMTSLGSTTVLIGNMPAARANDMTSHTACVAPIPGPTGKILPPGCPTVMIGGGSGVKREHFTALRPVCPLCRAAIGINTVHRETDFATLAGIPA